MLVGYPANRTAQLQRLCICVQDKNMDSKTSIVDKAAICGQTSWSGAQRIGQAAVLFVRRVSVVSKKMSSS